jgi:trk system potassium uptake protein TrkA
MSRRRYVVIVGAGEIGFHLARKVTRGGDEAALIEIDPERAKSAADRLGLVAYEEDGTDIEALRDAEVGRSDYFVAATGKDDVNLVACQLAKRYFDAPFTVARVTDPENEALFSRLGVDATVCTTAVAARMIGEAFPSRGMRLLSVLGRGAGEIGEIALVEGDSACGKNVAQLGLRNDCVLVAVIRDERLLFPRGETTLLAGDKVFAVAAEGAIAGVSSILRRRGNGSGA